nr:MAG TPA: hypothetical protein [Caudoviricetes sp.]DAV70054.1 MAG TPA: hypothetical protein [Caudoviricetes sp.]
MYYCTLVIWGCVSCNFENHNFLLLIMSIFFYGITTFLLQNHLYNGKM